MYHKYIIYTVEACFPEIAHYFKPHPLHTLLTTRNVLRKSKDATAQFCCEVSGHIDIHSDKKWFLLRNPIF